MANIFLKINLWKTFNLKNFIQKNYSTLNILNYQNRSSSSSLLLLQQINFEQQKRKLYSNEVLGVDRFLQYKEQIKQRFGKQNLIFIERLQEHILNEQNSILSEDLKNLIFLVETQEHVELLKKAIDKFEKQNESLRFGLFQFGPVVMRLAKHLNNVDIAKWIFNPNYKQFFSQLSSVTIAMDLLFENGYYEDVLKLFDLATTKFEFDVKYPADFVVLYFAACYKLNTIESFESSFRLLRSIQLSKNQIKLRGMYFFLLLAIRQNHSNIALEIIQNFNFKSFNLILQSIRLLANAKINRFHDVQEILQFYLKKDKAIQKNKIIFKDTLEEIIQLIEQSNKKEFIEKMKILVKNLEESNFIESKKTLEQALLEPIQQQQRRKPIKTMENQQQQFVG